MFIKASDSSLDFYFNTAKVKAAIEAKMDKEDTTV